MRSRSVVPSDMDRPGAEVRSIFFPWFLAILFVVSGCSGEARDKASNSSIDPPSPTTRILFTSNRDTGTRRHEIYAMDEDGKQVHRVTYSGKHHFIMDTDRWGLSLVSSQAERDTARPRGLGDEDARSLWFIDLVHGTEKRLTDVRDHAEGGSFSPDGQWIVFSMKKTSAKEDREDIYKIRRDGTGLVNLTRTPDVSEGDPAWSPDGREIAFIYLDRHLKRYVLKSMDPDGGGTRTLHDAGPGPVTRFPPGVFDPAWSSNGREIVFGSPVVSRGNWGNGIWHIYLWSSDGEVRDLSVQGDHADRAEYLPSFAPDGQSIVFGVLYEAKDRRESLDDIMVMDLEGTSLRRLTESPSSDRNPVWIP